MGPLTLSPPIPLRLYTFPYWCNPPVLIFDIRALALSPERQSTRMSECHNGGLDQYGVKPFEQQQFVTAGVEGVKHGSGCAYTYLIDDNAVDNEVWCDAGDPSVHQEMWLQHTRHEISNNTTITSHTILNF